MKLAELHLDVAHYPLTAVIDTALCVGAGGSSGSLADKPIVRNAEGRLIIPGSHLKGRLRHECEKIARALNWTVSESPNPRSMMAQRMFAIPGQSDSPHCIISSIFGDPSLPSCLLVDDLICETSPDDLPTEVIRPGVSLNRRRRTAEDQKLYYLETSPPNQPLQFKGDLHLLQAPPYAAALMVAGLKHIRSLGGSKSAGLGWLTWNISDDLLNAAKDPAAWTQLGGAS